MKPLALLALCLAASAFPPSIATAQDEKQLLTTLIAVNQRSLDAWRKQDRAAFAASFAPESVYVSSDGIFKLNDILDGLMTCTVGEVTFRNQIVRSISPTSALLISRQHQQVTCMGHQEPAELNSTLTFVKHDGEWRILMRTDTPASR